MDLKGKMALVTGASRGTGAAAAVLLARHGAAVAVNYVKNEAAARKVVETITVAGGRGLAIQADVRDPGEAKAMVTAMTASLGPIDIAVLIAGAEVPFKPFLNLSFDDFERKVMGELKGFFYPLQVILPGMVRARAVASSAFPAAYRGIRGTVSALIPRSSRRWTDS